MANPSILRCAERIHSNKSRHCPLYHKILILFQRTFSRQVFFFQYELSLLSDMAFCVWSEWSGVNTKENTLHLQLDKAIFKNSNKLYWDSGWTQQTFSNGTGRNVLCRMVESDFCFGEPQITFGQESWCHMNILTIFRNMQRLLNLLNTWPLSAVRGVTGVKAVQQLPHKRKKPCLCAIITIQ